MILRKMEHSKQRKSNLFRFKLIKSGLIRKVFSMQIKGWDFYILS